ncbi:MAG TPA: hypothetical protein PK513_03205 [Alphaproteobacteria bacterium]|nr:hypothetical protein [Alphaproteobacteria bacterium]USO05484.1 MAG: hypothetical protein H6859_10155 [Rhodospirillales bacterium]HOO81493.1 hypothetical protein [Alphaproteobacteria bacterium]
MQLKIIIGAFILLCALIYNFSPAQAQKKNYTPATHMWVQNYQNLLFVRVNSLEECEMFTAQAAAINSTEGHCYNGERLLKKIHCTKPVKRDGTPNCS